MSTTTSATQAQVRDSVISAAKDVPTLVAAAKASDPALYAALTKTGAGNQWYPVAVSAVSWLAAKYAVGWDATTCSAVAAVVLAAGTGVVHWLTARLAVAQKPG